MRAIERTTQFKFKRDFKREMKGRHRTTLETDLTAVLRALVNDAPLAEKYRDHLLSGEWSGFRDCTSNPTLCDPRKAGHRYVETGTAWIAQRTRMVSVLSNA